LPNHIITHAPQAPYFKQEYYRNGGYKTVDDRVGNTIDFYTVQFYNQGNTRYDSYRELFIQATGVFSGTAVKELIDRGIPAKKIVVGKPATRADVINTGYVLPSDLGRWLGQFKQEYNWRPSVMLWQFKNDVNGEIIKQVLNAAGVDYRDQEFMDDTTP
jgi:chitinase